MSHQRRRGVELKVWHTVEVTDRRGNTTLRSESTAPRTVRAWVIPERSARAEVPGQQQINVIRVGVDADVDVSLWGRIEYDGRYWDFASPPAKRIGQKRHTRHWSIDLRERPAVT